jgi:hypothetical protein
LISIYRLISAFFASVLLLVSNPSFALDPDAMTEREEYIAGNAYHVLMHEMGHLVIDQLRLAILGQEEDAADNFATIALIDDDTAFTDNALANTAHFWFVLSDEQSSDASNYFAEHDLDIQRAYRIVCHLVGVDAEAFDYLAQAAELSEENYETCGANFEQTADSWFSTLDAHKPEEGFQNQVNLIFQAPASEFENASMLLRDSMIVEDALAFINTYVALPNPITIRAETCGEANAFYYSADVSITMCYELINLYGEIFDDTQ